MSVGPEVFYDQSNPVVVKFGKSPKSDRNLISTFIEGSGRYQTEDRKSRVEWSKGCGNDMTLKNLRELQKEKYGDVYDNEVVFVCRVENRIRN